MVMAWVLPLSAERKWVSSNLILRVAVRESRGHCLLDKDRATMTASVAAAERNRFAGLGPHATDCAAQWGVCLPGLRLYVTYVHTCV